MMLLLRKAQCSHIANRQTIFLLNKVNQNFAVTHSSCIELQAFSEVVFDSCIYGGTAEVITNLKYLKFTFFSIYKQTYQCCIFHFRGQKSSKASELVCAKCSSNLRPIFHSLFWGRGGLKLKEYPLAQITSPPTTPFYVPLWKFPGVRD